MINYFFCYKVIFKIPHGNKGVPNNYREMGMKNSCNRNAKNRRKALLEKKNCHKTRPIFFRHLPDFLRYRGPSNILHNKYTNVLCLLGTRGRENVF